MEWGGFGLPVFFHFHYADNDESGRWGRKSGMNVLTAVTNKDTVDPLPL
jgi:hypothetical protein